MRFRFEFAGRSESISLEQEHTCDLRQFRKSLACIYFAKRVRGRIVRTSVTRPLMAVSITSLTTMICATTTTTTKSEAGQVHAFELKFSSSILINRSIEIINNATLRKSNTKADPTKRCSK